MLCCEDWSMSLSVLLMSMSSQGSADARRNCSHGAERAYYCTRENLNHIEFYQANLRLALRQSMLTLLRVKYHS